MQKILLLVFASGCSLISRSQVHLGIKAGYNLSNLTYSGTLSLEGQKPLSSFNAGLFANLPISPTFSLQAEAQYSGQGTKYQNSSGSGSIQYGYLNVPVLIKYQHPTGLFAETGLQIGFLLNTTEKHDGTAIDPQNKTYSPDYAWAMGLGYQVPTTGFGIDLRYNLGVINILNYNGGDANVKNSVFQFDLYYLFGSNK